MKNAWPHPGDSNTAIARKVALALRAELMHYDPVKVKELDLHFRSLGQHWLDNLSAAFDDDDFVDSEGAGNILGVSASQVSHYRSAGKITGVKHGRRFLYQVREVRRLAAARQAVTDARLALRTSGDNVSADRTSVE